ncbi:phage antirepressor [Caloranaerobacter sp. DY30410]|uniref:phage antirepressor n=1 Tax=Caloranaerobacter sp. DY30410 TaxID=3238305 RepID=UPI003CFE1D9C
MNDLQIFSNKEFGEIRIIEINGKPYAVGVDVARALGYKNPSKAVIQHCRGITKAGIPSKGGIQETNVIPEGDIYRLIIKSELPSAERFEKWVFDEVLPSIRKHGAYMTDEVLEKALTSPDFLIQLATKLKEERQKRIEAEKKVKELTPAAEFGNAIGNCKDAILIRDYCKILANAGINIGQDRMFSWLHANGYIYRDKGSNQWMAYKRYVDMGLFKVKETRISTNNHGDIIKCTIKITGKGQRYFYEKLKNQKTA